MDEAERQKNIVEQLKILGIYTQEGRQYYETLYGLDRSGAPIGATRMARPQGRKVVDGAASDCEGGKREVERVTGPSYYHTTDSYDQKPSVHTNQHGWSDIPSKYVQEAPA